MWIPFSQLAFHECEFFFLRIYTLHNEKKNELTKGNFCDQWNCQKFFKSFFPLPIWGHRTFPSKRSNHAAKSPIWMWTNNSGKYVANKHQMNAISTLFLFFSVCNKFVNTEIVNFEMEFIYKQLRLENWISTSSQITPE